MENYIWSALSFCKTLDSNSHFFVSCTTTNRVWTRTIAALSYIGVEKDVKKLKTIIIGYNCDIDGYDEINLIFTALGFSIYKSFYQSNCKKEYIDVINTFLHEMYGIKSYFEFKGIKVWFINKFLKHF